MRTRFLFCFFIFNGMINEQKEETVSTVKGNFMLNPENEVLKKAKGGCSDAFEEVFNKYKPIVFLMRKQYFLKGFEMDDWLQEGRIVCYQSLKKFQETKGVTFGSFFKINFERYVFSLLRRQEAYKRRVDKVSEPLDYDIESKAEFYYRRVDRQALLHIDYIAIKENISDYNANLSLLENNVLLLYLSGKDFLEIGEELEIKPSAAKYAYDRSKRKFKQFLKK